MFRKGLYALSFVLLAWSAYLFVSAWWGHWLFMVILSGGAVVIIATWVRRCAEVSPMNLIPAAILLLYYAGLPGKLVPWMTFRSTAQTYDAVLSYVDQGFGFSPSTLVAHGVGLIPHLDQLFYAVYMAMSLAMGICFAAHMGQSQPPWKIVVILAGAATFGVLCYNLIPACGPLMLVGARRFLHGEGTLVFSGPPPLVALPLKFPRNAMPSLHMSWALLLHWISRDSRRGVWLSAVFVVLTAVATLSTGEHYLVDLVVAFPFSFAIWNLFVGEVPLSHPKRVIAVTAGVLAYLAWTAAILFDPGLFYASPWILWLSSAVTVCATMHGIYRQPASGFLPRGSSNLQEETPFSESVC